MYRQLRVFCKHVHAASLGVGGRVEEAEKVSFAAGQAGYDADPELGEFGGETEPYRVARLVKSVDVVTVLPLTVTIPKLPADEVAGK